jgi:uncharacterized repeat protein (TIGR03803 family)
MGLALLLLGFATATTSPAQVIKTLFSFDGTDGVAPDYMFLVQATDGNCYGTSTHGGPGGSTGSGSVFKITPTGTETPLYNFCAQPNCTDGANPYAGLVQATDGNFYGTTYSGGSYGGGTIFKVTPAGTLTTLYSFCPEGLPCADGANPAGALIQGTDGNLYGTSGGDIEGPVEGTVFKITLEGTLTTLYNFCSQPNCTDGSQPFAGLVQGTDKNFYGTTTSGGTSGGGTVFRMTPEGSLTTIYNFCSERDCSDGSEVKGQLVQAADGNFYGTTELGGTSRIEGQGTVYKITPAGSLTTLHRFCEKPIGGFCPDSGLPIAGLTVSSNGYLAGTTSGDFNSPTIFGISPAGKFVQYTKAANTPAGLLQSTDGLFYGMAGGGTFGYGTIFSLGVGLGQFVKTSPTFGQIGTSVSILGSNLAGATSVSFNGTAAMFTIVSPSEITTSVPSAATTGRVKVTTPGGTLTSNLPFRVIQ